MKRRYRIQTITGKLFVQFSVILVCVIGLTSLMQFGIMRVAREETYDRMQDQSEYYLETLHKKMTQIREQQATFMYDWDFINISVNYDTMTDYERRAALLALRERASFFENSFDIVDSVAFYLPELKYVITGSSVKKMSEADEEKAEQYYSLANEDYYEDELEISFFEMNQSIRDGKSNIRQLSVVHISKKQIEQELENIVFGFQSGAFFVKENQEISIHKGENREISEQISRNLKEDGDSDYKKMQTVKIDGKNYLCFVTDQDWMGTFVQYTQRDIVMQELSKYQKGLWVLWSCIIFAAVFIVSLVRKQIYFPIKTLLGAFEKVKEGNLDERIYHEGKDEFQSLYYGFNDMQEKMKDLIERLAEQKNMTQNAELKQLQAQINPHFLYNSFFVLSRRIKREDYENASKFAELLGDYFRFVTRNTADDTTLEEETEHARCYAEIQGTRFISRIDIEFEECPEEYKSLKVPRLIVQPLLENAFAHGLENKVSDGKIIVRFLKEEGALSIIVEDNGDDTDEETVKRMREKIKSGTEGEITGIVNIHRRLQLYFRGEAGLKVEKSPLRGIQIRIYLTEKALKTGREEKG